MGLDAVSIETVDRKESMRNGVPGVIVATCSTLEDRNQVMKNKMKLKENRKYAKVYIDSDKPRKERQYQANLRLLVNALAKDTLIVKGDKVCKRQEGDNQPPPGGHRRGRGGGQGGAAAGRTAAGRDAHNRPASGT